MTIKKIIEKMENKNYERMKKGEDANGTHGILEDWYEQMYNCTHVEDLKTYRHKIYGLLCGLYGVNFITRAELNDTLQELKDTYNKICCNYDVYVVERKPVLVKLNENKAVAANNNDAAKPVMEKEGRWTDELNR